MIKELNWESYLLEIQFGKCLDSDDFQINSNKFKLTNEFSSTCNDNINNAKVLLASIVRECLGKTDELIYISIALEAVNIPIDSRSVGDVKIGAKSIIGAFKPMQQHFSSPFSTNTNGGVLIADTESVFTGTGCIEFKISPDLTFVEIDFYKKYKKFSDCLTEKVRNVISNYNLIETDFEIINSYTKSAFELSALISEKRSKLIKESWEAIFDTAIKWDLNYYSNGGDSIQAIRFLSKLKVLGANVQLSDLLKAKTMRDWRFSFGENPNPKIELSLSNNQKYPLSAMQSRIWNYYVNNQNNGAYHEQFLFELEFYSSLSDIKLCMTAIWKSYDQLRVKITEENGKYVQQVQNSELEFYEYNAETIEDALKIDKKKGFEDALIRISIFKIQNKEYLLWTHNHVILDGWSVGILIQEFVNRIDSKDFKICKNINDQLKVIELENEYKIKKYESNKLNKPSYIKANKVGDENRFEVVDVDFEKRGFSIEVSKLEEFKVTKQLFLCGLVGLVVNSLDTRNNIYFNSISSGRNNLEGNIESAVGLFIRNIQIPIPEIINSSWIKYFNSMKSSFEKVLIDDLSESLDVSENSRVSDVLFIYENYPYDKLETNSFKSKLIDVKEVTGYPLTICAFPSDESFKLRIVFNIDKYTKEFIESLIEKLEWFLKSAISSKNDELISTNEKKSSDMVLVSDIIGINNLNSSEIQSIIKKKLCVETINDCLLSDLFSKGLYFQSKTDLNVFENEIDYLLNKIPLNKNSIWCDYFTSVKGDFKHQFIYLENLSKEEILFRFGFYNLQNIWNSNYNLVFIKKEIKHLLLVEKEWNYDQLQQGFKEQTSRLEEICKNHENHMEHFSAGLANFAFSNEPIPKIDELDFDQLDLVLHPSSKNEFILSYRGNISDDYINGLTLYLNNDSEKIIKSKSKLPEFNFTKKCTEKFTFLDYFDLQVINNPNKKAIQFNNQYLSYFELNEFVNRYANFVNEKYDLANSTFIGIEMKRSIQQMIATLAVTKLGKAFIPIDINWPEERKLLVFQQAKLKVVLKEFSLDKLKKEYSGDNISKVLIKENSPLYCLYTSGSTGVPKGCVIKHNSFLNYLQHCESEYFNDKRENIHVFTSLCFDFTLTSYLGGISFGYTVIFEDEEISVYDNLKNSILDKHSNVIKVTPSHISLIEEDWLNLSTPKLFIVGGEALTKSHINKILKNSKHQLINEYGPTEATIGCITSKIFINDTPLIGLPIENMNAVILNDILEPVSPGIEGELFLIGVGLSEGYLNDPEKTFASFVNIPFYNNIRAYRTGDIVKMQREGNMIFMGRKDSQLKLNGYRIEAEEIQTIIEEYLGLNSALTIINQNNSSQLICFIEGMFDNQVLRVELAKKIPQYMIPAKLISVNNIPMTANGKQDLERLLIENSLELNLNYKLAKLPSINFNDTFRKWIDIPKPLKEILNGIHIKEYGWRLLTQQIGFLEKVNSLLNSNKKSKYSGLKTLLTSSLQTAENSQEFYPVEINLDKMLNEPWNLFIINHANVVSSELVYNCVKLLRENNKRIPEIFNSLIANTINRLVGEKNEETTFVDLVNLQSLKNLKNGSLAIVEEWSKESDIPVVVEKTNLGEYMLVLCDNASTNLKDIYGNYQIDNLLAKIPFSTKSELFVAYKINKSIYIKEDSIINRFNNHFSSQCIVENILINFPVLNHGYCTEIYGDLYFLYDTADTQIGEVLKEYSRDNLPLWSQPDYFIESTDFNVFIEQLKSSKNSEDLTSNFSNFIQSHLLEFKYLKGQYGLIEQGGDSITALRIIGRLRSKGFEAEIADLLNATSLERFFSRLVKSDLNSSQLESSDYLTPIQKWFKSEYIGNKNHFNQSILLEVLVPTDENQLKDVLQITLNAFPIFSMVYNNSWKEGLNPIVNIKHFSSEFEVTEHCKQIQKSFNLEIGPVCGGSVICFGGKTHLFISINHFYCDGFSWRLILDQLQNTLQGGADDNCSFEVFGKVDHAMKDLYEMHKSSSDKFYGETILNPFIEWKPYTYKESLYTEIEWSEDETKWFLENNTIGNSINEKFLFIVLWTWNELMLPPATPFFETHGRSYNNIFELSDSVGWFTQFYSVFAKKWPEKDKLVEEISKEVENLPEFGLTYMAHANWKKPPFPMLLNFLGNFDENWGGIAKPSNIDQGEMTAPENMVMGMVEINGMIIQGRLKWMFRSHQNFPIEKFEKQFNSIHKNLNEIEENNYDLDESIADGDIDTINDLLGNID
tara:strand:+ start:25595 stop:32302 length:6708 start_codon:yes stop_codon:yes gene_type:complete